MKKIFVVESCFYCLHNTVNTSSTFFHKCKLTGKRIKKYQSIPEWCLLEDYEKLLLKGMRNENQ